MRIFLPSTACVLRAALLFVLVLVFSVTINADHLSTGEDVTTFINDKIAKSTVMVFAKSYCPYCKNTIRVLQEIQSDTHFTLEVLQLDEMADAMDGPNVQMGLLEKTGQKTVPNIFIHGQHIGGNSDLVELKNAGELKNRIFK